MKKVIIGFAALLLGIATAEAQVSTVSVSHSADVSATSFKATFTKKPKVNCKLTFDITLGYQGSTTAAASVRVTKKYTAKTRRSKILNCGTFDTAHGVGVGPSDALPVLSVFVTSNNKCFGGVTSESSGGDAAFATCTDNTQELANAVFLNRVRAGLNRCLKALG